MKALWLALVSVLACDAAPPDPPARVRPLAIAIASEDAALLLPACALWSDLVTCHVAEPGEGHTGILRDDPFEFYGQCCRELGGDSLIVISPFLVEADGLDLGFVLAHEFGHRAGIRRHVRGPALMAEDAATTWGRPELAPADREAIAEVIHGLR